MSEPKLPPLPNDKRFMILDNGDRAAAMNTVIAYGWECYSAGVSAGMEKAAVICGGEYLEGPVETPEDIAYDLAIDHCTAAIRSHKAET